MRLSRSSTNWWLLAGGVTLLAWLGVQQYRWIERASEAERQERRQFLRTALGGLRGELNERLREPMRTFRPEPGIGRGADLESLVAARFRQWRQKAHDPALLAGVTIGWLDDEDEAVCRRMGSADAGFSKSEWPAAFKFYRTVLEQELRLPGGEPPFFPEGNAWELNGSSLTLIFPLVEEPNPERHPPGLQPAPPRRHPAPELRGWCFLEISPSYLPQTLSDLTPRYFGEAGTDGYQIALLSDQPPQVIYQSAPPNGREATGSAREAKADEELLLFPPGQPIRGRRMREGAGAVGREGPPRVVEGGLNFPAPPAWRLTARHRAGSLEEAVRRTRRQSLALSSGVLLLLLGSGVLLVVSTHRARALARRQMEFVAGVSHELRTPLSVIQTTSFNLAQGKVSDAGRVQQYGEAIQKEVRRLITQVEQMLSFAGIEAGGKLYDLAPVDVSGVIARALAEYAPAFEAEGWQIEQQLDAALPAAVADAQVLESAVKNLLQNALKYAGAGRWLGITAHAAGRQVQITVADRGPGIEPDDLPHVFEPFYRGRKIVGSATPGAGLGLSLVERHLRAMGGRVTVKSAGGQGAAFTLHLPAAKPD